MKRILSFFIPQVILTVLAFFISILLIFLLVIALGVDLAWQAPLGGVLIWILFPFAAYFNRRVYLPTHLEWIELVPVKKSSLILSNVIINILKLICIILASNILWALFFSTESFREYFSFSSTDALRDSDSFLPDALRFFLFTLSMTICLVTCFITGKEWQQAGERREVLARFRERKFILIFLALCTLLGCLIFYYESIVTFLPLSLKMAFFCSLFITAFVRTGFTANKIYYNKMTSLLMFSVTFLMFSAILLFNTHKFLTSDIENTEKKLQEFTKLGFMTRYYQDDIKKNLMSSSIKNTQLTVSELKNIFQSGDYSSLYLEVFANWNKRCDEGDATACRLISNLIFAREGFRPIQKLRMACPQDLRGCYDLITHHSATERDIALGEDSLLKSCGASSNLKKSEINKDTCCSCFHSYWKNKKAR